MGGRISAQNWYRDRRLRRSGEASSAKKSFSDLRAGKNGETKLDISVFCRVLWSMCTDDCEVSVCANDKPTKCYHVWQKVLYAPVPDTYAVCNPLFAPRRIIIPSKKSYDGIMLGSDICISLYVNREEIPGDSEIDKNFSRGRDIILERICAELPKAELSQRLMSPQNKGMLLKHFSRDFVESIKKEYSYGTLILKLPESINHNH